ncbi:acylneuraminate cytidylyltransferase family protein [Pedobacter sp. JY14-1]|uniref:acylneuraminate cytidylyltransferase family protein n=1 Tax=Pedobacter sp. JY14-1 TaxID=3034151 RepID=UPI0023E2FFAD|nr:acylneuraminate cytidylyltransferase family protein [Pedobacter sp. JY14-1]
MKILITLCGRGGSKGIPGKNIKLLAGKPLIAYSINVAKQFASKYDCKIALSTDSDAIRDTAGNLGIASEYVRPEILASDSAGKIDTIADLLLYEEKKNGTIYDFILDLDITSPLRTLEDLEAAFQFIVNDENALTLFSVNAAARNPYFNMVEKKASGYYGIVKTSQDGSIMTRQAAPAVYDLNASFYWYRRSFFDKGLKSPITEKSLIFQMDHICFDLDHPIDFEFLEYLLASGKVDLL